MKKICIAVASLITATTALATVTPTANLKNIASGKVILVTAKNVPANCNFREQIVNIGYDKSDHTVYACVKN